jgi:hypothetical protein
LVEDVKTKGVQVFKKKLRRRECGARTPASSCTMNTGCA